MQSGMLAPWHERIEREVSLLEDVVSVVAPFIVTGEQPNEALRKMLTHQLERLVQDVVVLTRMEEAKKE